jgi:predicted Mrr-cat superfamily restriction endonuclease
MKHLVKFNEEISRDELKDELSSSFTASGSLEKHAQEIKDELLSFVDELYKKRKRRT